jgi:hypothetical protein
MPHAHHACQILQLRILRLCLLRALHARQPLPRIRRLNIHQTVFQGLHHARQLRWGPLIGGFL